MFADAAFDHAAFDVFDVGVLVRGVDVCDDVDINAETCGLRADCTLRYPFNNGYRSVLNGRFTSPDPLHVQTQLKHLGPAVYTYAANRPQMYQDPDGRLLFAIPVGLAVAEAAVYGAGAELSLSTALAWGSVMGVGAVCMLAGICDELGEPTNGESETDFEADSSVEPECGSSKCPPCPPPPPPRIDRVPPSRPHWPCTGDHMHVFVMDQNPNTCACFPREAEVQCLQ